MASSAAPPGVVDPTKPKSYPVILSDALLGKPSKETLTAIRYNHKPALSSDTGPNEAELKPSSSDDDSFNLSFYENGGKYAYNGTRSAKENQYVLVFDPERKAFVLHRMDSMFHMNLARTPYNNDAQELKEKHPHIDSSIRPATDKKNTKASAIKARETTKKAGADSKKKEAPAAKAEEPEVQVKPSSSQADKDTNKKKARNRSPAESDEDEDEDGDGGLLVEYPDPVPTAPVRGQDFSPAFPTAIRRFSEFMRDEGPESDEDADAEYDEEDNLGEEDDDVSGEGGEGGGGFKLPSPVVGGGAPAIVADDADDDFGDDLEKELEKELEQEFSGMDVDDGGDAESDVSEED
ncbi:hypothetical protein J7T55_011863 [Diaporthe amygdali]|uniref:uncharacterized protein n=1 Tax=Phomopsis amygdali TaxID=1214568 RepID=UPI0022FE2DAC|nr:uncharacterized protein J7T55_011863 [Diaporthe amygdali]KAJ0123398.1 hypothetical protein J7T55_011863 [Diaporthe amygdali]